MIKTKLYISLNKNIVIAPDGCKYRREFKNTFKLHPVIGILFEILSDIKVATPKRTNILS